MGTSQSSAGPGSGSPLIPPWADDQPLQPIPLSIPQRFRSFRTSFSKFISSGDRNKLKKSLGKYARSASGGSGIASRRMGKVIKVGGALFGALRGLPANPGEASIDLNSLSGLQCDVAIAAIANALTTEDGDSNKIRTAINYALSEALEGVVTFDPQCITDEVIIKTMICYLSDNIFLLFVESVGESWNNAQTPAQAINREIAVHELIKIVVDRLLARNLNGNIRNLTRRQMESLKRQAVIDVTREWEAYR